MNLPFSTTTIFKKQLLLKVVMVDENNNSTKSVLDIDNDVLTPGMKQYQEVKKLHPDCLVMLRMGDFYEMFYQDAVTASRELEITLTARGKGDKRAPLAGIPYHALEPYLARLVKKGHKIAIVEQLEDPKLAKGLVKRGLVRIVTPGTIFESSMLNEKENNYLMALTARGEEFGLALCDVSTGEFSTLIAENINQLHNIIIRFNPSECLIPESLKVNHELMERLRNYDFLVNALGDFFFSTEKSKELLQKHFNLLTLDAFGIEDKPLNIAVSGALLRYLLETQKNTLSHLKKVSLVNLQQKMMLDSSTMRNLELTQNIRDGTTRGTLLSVLDKTVTSLGARLLRKWLKEPLLNTEAINKRLDAVEELNRRVIQREEIISLLESVYDLERLISKVNYGSANARDLLSLKTSLQQLPKIKQKLSGFECELLLEINLIDNLHELAALLGSSIREDAPTTIREGGIIKSKYHPELDQLHDLKHNSKKYLQELEEKEKQKTGIPLRLGYTKVFGYFIEVTHKNVPMVPADWIRKQTTVNTERYITPELKEIEEKILNAEEKIVELEYRLFQELAQRVAENTAEIQNIALKMGVLDVLCSLSRVALENNYVKPELVEQKVIQVKNGRHPVVEKIESRFIANDVFTSEGEMMIITGPNMAGKCLTGNSLIFTDKGLRRIEEFCPKTISPEKFIPLNVNVCGVNGSEETSHYYYDGERPTIKIRTKRGYDIEGTHNHPILIRNKFGKELWERLGEISKEDKIIISQKINLWGEETDISLKLIDEVIKSLDYRVDKKYKLPIKVTPELAYFLGLLIGDGTVTYKNCINFTNNDKQLTDYFTKISEKIFGYTPKIKKSGGELFISSVQIRSYLVAIGLDYCNAYNKSVPTVILSAPKEIIREFLSGLFDTDGESSKKYGNVSVSTSSLELAKQVHLLLLNFGIVSSLKPKKTKRAVNYNVFIYGAEVIKFYNEIGFKLNRKNNRRGKISNIRRPNIGIPYLNYILKNIQQKIVANIHKKTALKKVKNINSIFYTYIPNKRNISYDKLKELIDYCHENNINCEELELIYDNHYFYDSIEFMEESKMPKKVYDFTVPRTHSFIANGLINHNSTTMRQTALIVLMAQVGSFVPADKAVLGVVDRIFTRVGAYDDLSSGQSTFMIEMTETANILNNATEKSLIILDEIGRGTSTFDGVSIAWSVAEYLINHTKAKTLFSTHYHVLNKLAEKFSRIKNYNIAVRESKGEVIFLHKLVSGGTDESYGIHVAKLAGLPEEVVKRAEEIQGILQADDDMMRRIKAKKLTEQMSLERF